MLCSTVHWATWCSVMFFELISRFTYIAGPAREFVCVCTWVCTVCTVCVLCNIPNLSNFGPRLEALLFSWRSRWPTKTFVHFGNRPKLWTIPPKLPATYLNNLLPEFQVDVWTWTCDVNVRVDMVVGARATYHGRQQHGPIQAEATRQEEKQFKCYCTFRLHVLAAAAAAPIQCLIFRAVLTPAPPPPPP